MSENVLRNYIAELLGTFALVFFGCASAVIAGKYIGFLGIALVYTNTDDAGYADLHG